ncbi:MAG TPA: hypothetical protein VFS21_08420 [Roseiflexaceae bacterium]|nr:hypothetical protein [Roseiflexaceae bacterium]
MMARFWRWILVCTFAVAGILCITQGMMAASQQPDGVALVRQLEEAGPYAPERFAGLTLAEKRTVLKALTPAYTTVRQIDKVAMTPLGRDGITSYAAGWWAAEYAHDSYSDFDIHLWTFRNRIEWCGDDSVITNVLGYRVIGTPHAPFWFYNGIRTENDLGGVGQPFYAHFAQGDFQLCMAGIKGVGCVLDKAPYIEMRGYADGSSYRVSGV